MAHWFESGADASICGRLKPDRRGAVWRHPTHDRHVTMCAHCQAKLKDRKTTEVPEGVDDGGDAEGSL
jgi:hypothetical protein